jgi:hypothetical protein
MKRHSYCDNRIRQSDIRIKQNDIRIKRNDIRIKQSATRKTYCDIHKKPNDIRITIFAIGETRSDNKQAIIQLEYRNINVALSQYECRIIVLSCD